MTETKHVVCCCKGCMQALELFVQMDQMTSHATNCKVLNIVSQQDLAIRQRQLQEMISD